MSFTYLQSSIQIFTFLSCLLPTQVADRIPRSCAVQEKILPFVPVSEAVKLPGDPSPADEIEAELARLRVQRGTDEAQLDTEAKDGDTEHTAATTGTNAAAGDAVDGPVGLYKGPNDAAVQVCVLPFMIP